MSGTLVLVRHGQSEWNLKNLLTGCQGRIGAEGRRHLGRFEDAEPSARSGAHEDDASALAQRRRIISTPTAIRSRSRWTAASILRSSLIIRSTMSPGASLSIPRLEGLMASVGSDCHLERMSRTILPIQTDNRVAEPARPLWMPI